MRQLKLDVLFVSILIMIGSLILVLIGLILRKKPKTSEIGVLGFLLGVNALYIIGYALELAASSPELKLIFNHVQYIGLPFIAPLWLIMCRQFCRKQSGPLKKTTVILFLLPVVTLVLNLTHTVNGLYYSDYRMVSWGGFDAVVFTKGLWYFVETGYKTALLAVTVWLYARALSQSSGVRKKQSATLLALSIIGVLLSAASVFSATTATIDFFCILLSSSFVLIAVILFKYELFGLIPLAYSRLFDVLDQPVLILSETRTVVRANAEAAKVFALNTDVKRQPRLDELFESNAEEGNSDDDDTRYFRKSVDGQPRYFAVNLISLDPESSVNIKGFLAVLTDMTSHIEQIKTLESLAAGDPLTGLYNRRHFFTASEKILSEAKASGHSVSLVVFDIDHFKNINDAYGHQAGDYVLRTVSEAIGHQLRKNDVLARFGGDEFVLMLGSADSAMALTVANRICSAVRDREYTFDGRPISLTLSAGIGGGDAAIFSDLDELLSLADSALYDAKSIGRNRVCVSKQCTKKG